MKFKMDRRGWYALLGGIGMNFVLVIISKVLE